MAGLRSGWVYILEKVGGASIAAPKVREFVSVRRNSEGLRARRRCQEIALLRVGNHYGVIPDRRLSNREQRITIAQRHTYRRTIVKRVVDCAWGDAACIGTYIHRAGVVSAVGESGIPA